MRLKALSAKQAREIAENKLRWEPPPDEADMPGQAARFAGKRLESWMRRLLEGRSTYSITRFAWRLVKKLRP